MVNAVMCDVQYVVQLGLLAVWPIYLTFIGLPLDYGACLHTIPQFVLDSDHH